MKTLIQKFDFFTHVVFPIAVGLALYGIYFVSQVASGGINLY